MMTTTLRTVLMACLTLFVALAVGCGGGDSADADKSADSAKTPEEKLAEGGGSDGNKPDGDKPDKDTPKKDGDTPRKDDDPAKKDEDPEPKSAPLPVTQGAGAELLSKDLTGWQPIKFGGEGDTYMKDGVLHLDYGSPLTALKFTADLKTLLGEDMENYVISLEAKRVEGTDMFLGFTFPVGTVGHVSLVLGGWGGALTGISSLDDLNASENDTTDILALMDNTWYKVTIQVTPDKINCWLDDKQIVDVVRAKYKKFSTHPAVIDTVPFAMFSYDTWGAVRNLKVWQTE